MIRKAVPLGYYTSNRQSPQFIFLLSKSKTRRYGYHKGGGIFLSVYCGQETSGVQAPHPAVHISVGCAPETIWYLVTILAYPQLPFAHVIAVMNPEVIQG